MSGGATDPITRPQQLRDITGTCAPKLVPEKNTTLRQGDSSVDVRISGLYHGTFGPDGATPCTLLLLTFRLGPRTRQRRFRSASITACFEDARLIGGRDPELLRLAPDGVVALTDPATAAEVPPSNFIEVRTRVAGVDIGYKSGRRAETPEWTPSSSVTGAREFVREDSERPTGARWTMAENPLTLSGIPSETTLAVLLGHSDRRFRARICVQTEGGGGSVLGRATGRP